MYWYASLGLKIDFPFCRVCSGLYSKINWIKNSKKECKKICFWTFSEVSIVMILLWLSCRDDNIFAFQLSLAWQLSTPWLFAPFILGSGYDGVALWWSKNNPSPFYAWQSYTQLNSLELLPQLLFLLLIFWIEMTIELLH